MISSTTIIAIIVVVAFCVATAIIVRVNSPKRKLLKYIKSKCLLQAAVLLDKDDVSANYTFSPEEIASLQKLQLEEWKHWHSQVETAKVIAKSYPTVFIDFIHELFPKVSRRKSVIKQQSNRRYNKVEVLIEGLKSEELSLVIAETEESWKERIATKAKVDSIKNSNKEGYDTYCEIKKTKQPTAIDILRDSKEIEELQKVYNQSTIYKDWENRQKDFSTKYYEICKEHRECDGRFTYQVKFSYNDRYGKRIESDFKVWQGFVGSYSYECEDLQPSHMISTRNNLPEWKSKDRYYYNKVYDGIFQVIEKLSNMHNSKPLVVFVFSSRYEWDKDTYNYHYKYLRNQLQLNDYETIDMELITNVSKEKEYESVIIIDLITHNDDLKNNCKLLAEYFTKKQPNIAYYSLLKEYSKEEVKRFYKKKVAEKKVVIEPAPVPPPDTKDENIEFIKSQFQRVNKHSFFSYIAITNTLIGEAGNAEQVKAEWLDIPSKYHITTDDCNNSQIGVHYSTDGKVTYTEYHVKGNSFSLDDVVEYTYNLFKLMGVLSQFRSKGSRAIDYMNDKGLLSHH